MGILLFMETVVQKDLTAPIGALQESLILGMRSFITLFLTKNELVLFIAIEMSS